MKKTLIALLALAGVATADQVYISNANISEPGGTPSLVDPSTSDLVISSEGLTAQVVKQGSTTFTSTGYTNSFAKASVNVGNGDGTWTYTLNFTISSIGEGVQVSGMNIDFFSYSGQGKPQNQKNGYNAAITLSKDGADVYSTETLIETSIGNNQSVQTAYLDDKVTIRDPYASFYQFADEVNLEEGSYVLKIDITRADAYTSGVFAGVGNVSFTTTRVPEPTTGSLSLLALAGLCIRRRK